MTLNRNIKLNKQIRQDIIHAVEHWWMKENPRPAMPPVPTADQVKRLNDWQGQRKLMVRSVTAALETFSSVNQLEDLWPAIVEFVPPWVIDPAKSINLPEKI